MSGAGAWTPGPYEAVPRSCGGSWRVRTADTQLELADVWEADDETDFPAEANARLFAAALTFAEIVARIQCRANECGGDYDDIPRDELNALLLELDGALTRARGEQP